MATKKRGPGRPPKRKYPGRPTKDCSGLITMQETARRLGICSKTVQQDEASALMKLFIGLRDDPEVQNAFCDLFLKQNREPPGLRRLRHARDAAEAESVD